MKAGCAMNFQTQCASMNMEYESISVLKSGERTVFRWCTCEVLKFFQIVNIQIPLYKHIEIWRNVE